MSYGKVMIPCLLLICLFFVSGGTAMLIQYKSGLFKSPAVIGIPMGVCICLSAAILFATACSKLLTYSADIKYKIMFCRGKLITKVIRACPHLHVKVGDSFIDRDTPVFLVIFCCERVITLLALLN